MGTISNGTTGSTGSTGSGSSPKLIANSLRIRGGSGLTGGYLSRTPSVAGNRRTWTFSAWIKRGDLSARVYQRFLVGTGTDDFIRFNYDKIEIMFDSAASGGASYQSYTYTVWKDPSAWYHVMVAVDTTQATASNRVKLYINGVLQNFYVANYPALNYQSSINNTVLTHVCSTGSNTNEQFDGHFAEVHFVDGQQLTPATFGFFDYNGAWRAKTVSGVTYGTNGFYLPFSNTTSTTTLCSDSSGNNNNWTATNVSLTAGLTYDAMLDAPYPVSTTVGNYCVMNPIDTYLQSAGGSVPTFSAGNLRVTGTAATTTNARASLSVNSGKWYWEATYVTDNSQTLLGMARSESPYAATYCLRDTGTLEGLTLATGAGFTWTTNDVISMGFDLDAGTCIYYKNGVQQFTATFAGAGLYVNPWVQMNGTDAYDFNFGQRPFAYSPPSGYNRLQTYNLPNSTIVRPRDYFDCLLWTGVASTVGRSFTGLGFSPDLIWSTYRTAAGVGNASKPLVDTVRGVGKAMFSDQVSGEVTNNQYGYVSSFDSNGWTTAPGTTGVATNSEYNQLGRDFVAWHWKKGAVPGFNIVAYTGDGVNGRAIAHGLGATPAMWFVKRRDTTSDWYVAHKSFGFTNYLLLNSTVTSSGGQWFNSSPTSTNFYVGGTGNNVNETGATYIAYLWSEVAGFSKFGTYSGNGSANGPFVNCGFKPRWIMVKDTSGANWEVYDSSRNSINPTTCRTFPSNNSPEDSSTYNIVNILSNGFKVTATYAGLNESGKTYIFAAFADEPFKFATAHGDADRK